MNAAFVTTYLNEENDILSFLKSLFKQSKLPKEIILVDGGSTDKTNEKIKEFLSTIPSNKKAKVKIVKKIGNRSKGRNAGIALAKQNVIAVSDVGCILEKRWFERIVDPFKNSNVDVVSGFYKPICNNVFEKCLSTYTCTMQDKLNHDFLPSSRSVAFKKSAWKKVNGYPKDLDTCEDLVFAKKLRKKKLVFKLQKNAIVYWPQRKNIFEAAKQFFSYSQGDGKARYVRKNTPLLFLRYLILCIVVVTYLKTNNSIALLIIYTSILLYIIWSIKKNYRYVKDVKSYFILPILQVVSDLAVMLGMCIGFAKSLTK